MFWFQAKDSQAVVSRYCEDIGRNHELPNRSFDADLGEGHHAEQQLRCIGNGRGGIDAQPPIAAQPPEQDMGVEQESQEPWKSSSSSSSVNSKSSGMTTRSR